MFWSMEDGEFGGCNDWLNDSGGGWSRGGQWWLRGRLWWLGAAARVQI